MNKKIFAASLAGVLLFGSVAASPYITLYQSKRSFLPTFPR